MSKYAFTDWVNYMQMLYVYHSIILEFQLINKTLENLTKNV
jgi:phenylalanine-4-hydroxylase